MQHSNLYIQDRNLDESPIAACVQYERTSVALTVTFDRQFGAIFHHTGFLVLHSCAQSGQEQV